MQEVGEAFFPGAFAGDLSGEVGFALSGNGQQVDEERHLVWQAGWPKMFAAGQRGGCGIADGRRCFWLIFRVDRKRCLQALKTRAQPADLAVGFFAGALFLGARGTKVSIGLSQR